MRVEGREEAKIRENKEGQDNQNPLYTSIKLMNSIKAVKELTILKGCPEGTSGKGAVREKNS